MTIIVVQRCPNHHGVAGLSLTSNYHAPYRRTPLSLLRYISVCLCSVFEHIHALLKGKHRNPFPYSVNDLFIFYLSVAFMQFDRLRSEEGLQCDRTRSEEGN